MSKENGPKVLKCGKDAKYYIVKQGRLNSGGNYEFESTGETVDPIKVVPFGTEKFLTAIVDRDEPNLSGLDLRTKVTRAYLLCLDMLILNAENYASNHSADYALINDKVYYDSSIVKGVQMFYAKAGVQLLLKTDKAKPK